MAHDRLMRLAARLLLFAVLLFAGHGLASCSSPPQLPDAARAALIAHWESLPSHPGVWNRTIREWPGEVPTHLAPWPPLMEIWCVEAEALSSDDPAAGDDRLVWIVTRDNEGARWTAALLATMSSIWPYQACGVAPGS